MLTIVRVYELFFIIIIIIYNNNHLTASFSGQPG